MSVSFNPVFVASAFLAVGALGCRKNVTPSAPDDASVTLPAAPAVASTPAAPRDGAHAEGTAGSVQIVSCAGGPGLAMRKNGSPEVIVVLGFDETSIAPSHVSFADLDGDGVPDAVLERPSAADAAAPFVRYFVYLTTAIEGDPTKPCHLELTPDHGSDAFLLGSSSLPGAVAALSSVARRAVTSKEACALIDGPGFARPTAFTYEEASKWGELSGRAAPGQAVVSCAKRVPDGKSFLEPVFRCDAWRPYCEFALVSGGDGGTPIPPSERRYWFAWSAAEDAAGGRLRMLGAAVPH